MAEAERSILEILKATGREPPEVRLPPALAEGTDGGGAAVGRAGRYEVIGPLAEGGVGEILRGRDLDLGRDVALKVLRPKHASNPELVQRLLDEAQIGGQLQHPGIVPVYEIGVDAAGRPFLAMKLVKGRTLAAHLAERVSPSDERRRLVRVFHQLAQAVSYAHARGVVHRDLKPSNVMIGSFGEVQVLDWGFAKVLRRGGLADEHRGDSRDADQTRIAVLRTAEQDSLVGSVMGTPAYMPPEQALGEVDQLDERCDVFALGAILCEILTGQPPYVGPREDVPTLAAQARLDDAHARLDVCGADAALVALCRRCLEPLRADRPRDASGVADEVQRHLASVEERVRRARIDAAEARAAREKAEAEAEHQRKGRRQSLFVGAGVIALLVALAGGAWGLRADERAQAERRAGAVVAALADAERLRGEGRLDEAEAAAARATALEPVDRVLRDRAAALLTAIGTERSRGVEAAAQAARDTEMRRRLEAIEARRPDRSSSLGADGDRVEALAHAFRTYGLDLQAVDVASVAEAIRASAIGDDLLRALQLWTVSERFRLDERSDAWKHLLAVHDAATPDAWSRDLLHAVLEGDVAALRRAARDAGNLEAGAGRSVTLANWLQWAGEPERALALIDARLEVRPDDRTAHVLAQGLGWRLDRPERVRRHALVYAALDPAAPSAFVGMVNASRYERDWDGAIFWQERVLDADPEDFEQAPWLVALHEQAGSLERAMASWRGRREAEGDEPLLLALLASSHGRRGEVGEAVALLERLVQLRQDSGWAVGMLAALRSAQGEEDEALALWARAARLAPGSATAPKAMGACLASSTRSRAPLPAMEALARFLALWPEAPRLAQHHFLLAYAAQPAGYAQEEPLVACREAAELVPWSPWPHAQESQLLQQHTLDGAAAYRAARRAVDLAPFQPAVHLIAGRAAFQAGLVEVALGHLQAALQLDASNWWANTTWIWLLTVGGRGDEAVQYFRGRVAEQETKLDRHFLGISLIRAGRYAEAVELLERHVREAPDDAGRARLLAVALYRAGRSREAVRVLEATLENGPLANTRETAYLTLAELHLRHGEPERARAAYLEALRLGGSAAGYNQRHVAYAAACCSEPEAARAWCESYVPSIDGYYTRSHIACGIAEALFAEGRLPEAIAWLEEACRLAVQYDFVRNMLGKALLVRGDLARLTEALAPDERQRCEFSTDLLWEKGRFGDAAGEIGASGGQVVNAGATVGLDDLVGELRRNRGRLDRLAAWGRRIESLRPHEADVVAGRYEPGSAEEALDAAELARCAGAYGPAARYFERALRELPPEALGAGGSYEGLRIRFRAARAAVRAAADEADAERRRALHEATRAWLRAELPRWRAELAARPPRGRAGVSVLEHELWHWKHHLDLGSVWDVGALSRLPEDEREAWEAFWNEVDEVLATPPRAVAGR